MATLILGIDCNARSMRSLDRMVFEEDGTAISAVTLNNRWLALLPRITKMFHKLQEGPSIAQAQSKTYTIAIVVSIAKRRVVVVHNNEMHEYEPSAYRAVLQNDKVLGDLLRQDLAAIIVPVGECELEDLADCMDEAINQACDYADELGVDVECPAMEHA